MKIVYPKIDLGLQSGLHPRHQDLKTDFIQWMVEKYNVQDANRLEKYGNTTMALSRMYSNFEYSDRLLWVSRLFALWFLIDDIVDEKDTWSEDADEVYSDLLVSIRNPGHKPYCKYVAAHMEVMAAIESNSPEYWFIPFQEGTYQYFYYNHFSATRNDDNVKFANAQFVRILSIAGIPAYTLHQYLSDRYLSPRVLFSPYFRNLEHLIVRITIFCNDIASFEKEIVQNPGYLTIVALKRRHGTTYQAAIDEMARFIEEDLNAFRAQAAECVNLFGEEDAKTLQFFIGHMLTGIQGNKEYCDCFERYDRGKNDVCESV